MDESEAFVAVGNGEDPPWGHDRICPDCGQEDLPLLDSDPPLLKYIQHCGKTWLRGPIGI
jgi:hypothetical protein